MINMTKERVEKCTRKLKMLPREQNITVEIIIHETAHVNLLGLIMTEVSILRRSGSTAQETILFLAWQ